MHTVISQIQTIRSSHWQLRVRVRRFYVLQRQSVQRFCISLGHCDRFAKPMNIPCSTVAYLTAITLRAILQYHSYASLSVQCCYVNYAVHNIKPSNGGTQWDWQLQGAARHLAQTPARCCTPPGRQLQGAAWHLASTPAGAQTVDAWRSTATLLARDGTGECITNPTVHTKKTETFGELSITQQSDLIPMPTTLNTAAMFICMWHSKLT